MTPTTPPHQQSRRAFSLIELLIVILIIAMVTAIVLPALAHARKAARNAATRNLMVQVSQACSSFELSERKLPGYFTEQEMGSTQNDTNGFTEMENVMFDLAGGVVAIDGQHPAWYGPTATHLVAYDGELVGVASAGSKAYFAPPRKYFKKQDNGGEGLGTKVAIAYHIDGVRDLVDAEGTPILMWRANNMASQPIAGVSDFAQPASGGATPARFYWNANAAFLKSTTCGDKLRNQNNESLLGGLLAGSTAPTSLMGILGNPTSPLNITATPILPSAARGQFVLHAAGSDATFVGRNERGAKVLQATDTIDYGLNFRGQPAKDLMSDFDDILIAGG